jgi:hypothetical protein
MVTSSLIAVKFAKDTFVVELSDGRALAIPHTVSAKLMSATPQQREVVRLTPSGLHRDRLDVHLGIRGLLRAYEERVILSRLPSVRNAIKVDLDDL